MKILVTGASGFLGKYVINALLQSSIHTQIFAISQKNINAIKDKNLTWIKLDLHDFDATRSALEKISPDVLIHLAWYAEHGKFWDSLENIKWICTTISLLESFKEFGGSKVFIAGTCAEYDANHGPCIEGLTPIKPESIYAKSKDLTRQIAVNLCNKWKINLVWGRIFFPYGPGEALTKLIPSTLISLRNDSEINISHGNQQRDFIHAWDVAQAISLLATNPSCDGEFNISSQQAISIKLIVSLCQKSTNKLNSIVNYGTIKISDGGHPILIGSNQKLSNLGWFPKHNLEQSISEYIEYIRSAN
jgi:nucleoside-diphosphate-sugar epimerase